MISYCDIVESKIVEAMKLMNEIVAECDGTVEKVLAENGEMVEYGQPLFCIK